jgi:hypothetical protein
MRRAASTPRRPWSLEGYPNPSLVYVRMSRRLDLAVPTISWSTRPRLDWPHNTHRWTSARTIKRFKCQNSLNLEQGRLCAKEGPRTI